MDVIQFVFHGLQLLPITFLPNKRYLTLASIHRSIYLNHTSPYLIMIIRLHVC